MKKVLLYMMACMAILLVAFSFNSCNKNEDDFSGLDSEEGIIGTWEGITEDEWFVEDNREREEVFGEDISNTRYEFKSDMTFIYYENHGSGWKKSETGKWELSKNSISLVYYYPNDGGYDYDDPEVYEILELSESSMILEFYDKDLDLELYSKSSYRRIGKGNDDGIVDGEVPIVEILSCKKETHIESSIAYKAEIQITNDMGLDITKKGICYGTTAECKQTSTSITNSDGNKFTVALSWLKKNQKYYVKAFATNKEGTGYSKTVSFVAE